MRQRCLGLPMENFPSGLQYLEMEFFLSGCFTVGSLRVTVNGRTEKEKNHRTSTVVNFSNTVALKLGVGDIIRVEEHWV